MLRTVNPVKRYRGSLLPSLAAGDALGTSLEFTIPGSFAPSDSFEIPCTRRVPHFGGFAGFVVFRAY